MFNDNEARSALNKMHEYSPVDGFVDISEGLGDMFKSMANEPSVGLFYVQQHTHNAVPNLINLRNNITGKSREMSLHTEDSEDSIAMVRSMKECGFPILNDMINDITKSLAIMSTKQPKKGLISSKSMSGFQTGTTSTWSPSTWGRSYSSNGGERSTNYLSTVFNSAKQKATRLAQLDLSESMAEDKNSLRTSAASTSTTATEELPVSQDIEVDELLSNLSVAENFDEFKAEKEAKLEEWLGGDGIWEDKHKEGGRRVGTLEEC